MNGENRKPRAVRTTVSDEDLAAIFAGEREELERTWARPRGIRGWVNDTDHKAIALRYVATAFIFFILGGIEAALMRIQLARPENHFLNPDQYNQVFTVHGTTMMFLFAVPMMTAMGVYLVPLMVGSRDVVFPRLNLYGYFVYLIGGDFLCDGFLLNLGSDDGGVGFCPLAGAGSLSWKWGGFWGQTYILSKISALVGVV